MHRFIDFYSILYGVLGGLDKASFGLIARFVLIFFAKLAKFPNGYSLFFDSLLPYLKVFITLFFLSLPFSFLFFHPKDLYDGLLTSASSGIAKGLSYLGAVVTDGNRGRLPFLDYSSNSRCFMSLSYIKC